MSVMQTTAPNEREAFAEATSELFHDVSRALLEFQSRVDDQWVQDIQVRPGLNADGSVFYDITISYDKKKE